MVEKKRKAKKPKKKVIHQKQKQKQSISITIDNSKKSVARASGTKQMSGLGSSSSSSTVIPYGTYTSFQQQPMMQPMLQPPIQQPQNLANQQLAPIPQQGQYLGQAPAQYPNYNLPSVRTLQGADTLSAISYDTFDTDSITSIPHLSAFSPSQHTMSAFVLPPQPYNLPVSQSTNSTLSQAQSQPSMNSALYTPQSSPARTASLVQSSPARTASLSPARTASLVPRRPATPPPPTRRQQPPPPPPIFNRPPRPVSRVLPPAYEENLEDGGFVPQNPNTGGFAFEPMPEPSLMPTYPAPVPKERKKHKPYVRTTKDLMDEAGQTILAIDPTIDVKQKKYDTYAKRVKFINDNNNQGFVIRQQDNVSDLANFKVIQHRIKKQNQIPDWV